MNKNKLLPLALLSASFLSACGMPNSTVKPTERIRGTTNNETINGYRSFELGEAILLFMPDKNMEYISWDFRADAPIEWMTNGYKTEKADSKGEAESFREGLMRINVQGIESHILRKKKEELAWKIHYSTFNPNPKFGVESIQLQAGDSEGECFGELYDNCTFEAEKSMKDAGVFATKVCENPERGGGPVIGYELSFPNKEKTNARLETNGGSGGSNSLFMLIFKKDVKNLCSDFSSDIYESKIERP